MKPMTRPDFAKLRAFLTAPDRPPASEAAHNLAMVGVAKRQAKIDATTAQLRAELGR